MKNPKLLLNKLFLIFMLCFITSEVISQTREIFTLQKDWKFTKGNPDVPRSISRLFFNMKIDCA